MGIKNLNKYLTGHCSKNSIFKTHLKNYHGKTVAVDTSIYMYKFMAQEGLIEYIYLMITIFLKHKITPIFVFDGKPPPEKREILKERSRLKKEAEKKYNAIKNEMEQSNSTENAKNDILAELESLKKKFVRIKDEDVTKVKEIMDAYGVMHCDADGEADKLCVYLVQSGKAWACVSDDMDMFVYGCKRVMRHMSLLGHTVVLYNLDEMLNELSMSLTMFRKILVLSGTDYNCLDKTSLRETLKFYENFKDVSNSKSESFYEWLNANTTYIKNYNELMHVYDMFCVNEDADLESKCDSLSFFANRINYKKLQDILKTDGFVFL